MRRNTIASFWLKVQKTEGCWLWLGGRDPDGYGIFSWKNKSIRAHKFSYQVCVGPVEDGLQLRHSCDTPACVNPTHLFPGTALDNATDREVRGRGLTGRKQSEEHKARKAASRYGKKWTPEMKRKMSLRKRGLL